MIDCDLRKSSLHKLFNFPNTIGLSNIIINEVSWLKALQKSEIENLFVLTAGIKPPNPAELISSERMKTFLEELAQSFDYIIIDAPPVGIITDAQVIAQFADGCLLVIASGDAIIKETLKSKELIEHVNGRILGVALNKVKDLEFTKYYDYYNGNGNNKFWKK